MRARLALAVGGQTVELREVVLRHKPPELLAASPKGTVPVLVLPDGSVIDQSLDIMRWALAHHDPAGWLQPPLDEMLALIAAVDGPFKHHLDRYKYPGRYEDDSCSRPPDGHRGALGHMVSGWEQRLAGQPYLFGPQPALADMAIAPFVRQCAHVDAAWFAAQPWPRVQKWLADFENSALFVQVMQKVVPWESGSAGVPFPTAP
ncbi:glutathione S-transferase [Rhodoferax sp. WC2427]|uniref:glutathione S-transferase n=1 Tax=Rhodoferax sp. WC2427 TaxID=3234144 RepID=UPI00346538EE